MQKLCKLEALSRAKKSVSTVCCCNENEPFYIHRRTFMYNDFLKILVSQV